MKWDGSLRQYQRPIDSGAKRFLDVTISCVLLLMTAPLLGVVALLIKLETRGPILYRHPCLGRWGKPFGRIRFCTMDKYYDPADTLTQRQLTRIGGWIRNYSIDDVPNLINVICGEMSIVGPRPTEPYRVDLNNSDWRRILSVRPGWMGLAILRLGSSFNSSSPEVKRQLELDYIAHQSFIYDLRLLLKCIQAHIRSRGNIKARGKTHSS